MKKMVSVMLETALAIALACVGIGSRPYRGERGGGKAHALRGHGYL